jgi:heme-degrading monooxygenase HmoA
MYARSTAFAGRPENVDAGIAYVRNEVMPVVERMDGCVGLSMLADRDSGRCVVTTAWESEEALRASAERVRESRSRAGEVLGGRPEAAEWEVALVHRARPADAGARTRVMWGRGDAARMSEAHAEMRESVLPQLEELPGFCSVSFLVDRGSGRTATTVTYANREAMEGANDRAMAIRAEFTRSVGMEVVAVAEFDLVIAHLRIPELV